MNQQESMKCALQRARELLEDGTKVDLEHELQKLAADFDLKDAECEVYKAEKEYAVRRAELWQAIATRNSQKIIATISNGETISEEIQAGIMEPMVALSREWVREAPRFVEATFEDNEGLLTITVRKAEAPSPIELLKKAEAERDQFKSQLETCKKLMIAHGICQT